MDDFEDFTWGVATSAYQIEGGRGPGLTGESIWDCCTRAPGVILGGADGSVTRDHYHRVDEDVDLMARLGVDAYRFSIAWTRVVPGGTGVVDRAGLGFATASSTSWPTAASPHIRRCTTGISLKHPRTRAAGRSGPPSAPPGVSGWSGSTSTTDDASPRTRSGGTGT